MVGVISLSFSCNAWSDFPLSLMLCFAWSGLKTYQLVLEPGQVYVLKEGP